MDRVSDRNVEHSSSPDDQLLASVGIQGRAEVIDRIPWPEEDTALGLRQTDSAAWKSATATYLPVGTDPDLLGGILSRYERDPGVVRFQPRRGVQVESARVPAETPPESLIAAPDHVTVHLRRANAALIELSDRTLLLRLAGLELVVFEIVSEQIDIRPLVSVPSPSGTAVDACTDEWLRERMREHLRMDDAWHHAVTAGLHVRFERADPASRGRIPTVAESWPHVWIRSLSGPGRDTLVARAVARVHALWTDMERLQREVDPEDDDWRDDFVRWCRDRDDLEGVRALLNWSRAGRPLEQVLAPFDKAADRFVQSMPVALRLHDEQLARATAVHPTAWWTHFLRLREPDS